MPHLTTPSSPFNWLPTTPFPSLSTILLIQHYLSHHLPPELVDIILNHAEFWAHSTTTTPDHEPVRAFGPFTWGWGRGGRDDRIDYLNVWCPAGPGYAHRWRRWGESRRDDGFVLRSGGIGLLQDDDEGERERHSQWSSRCLRKNGHLVRSIFSLYQKGTAAGLRVRHRCQKSKKLSGRGITNEIPAPSKTAAARKIIFETWSHQDYFGAVGDSAAAADDDDGGAQHFARVFCDVSINRKSDASHSAFWKRRILRCWRGGNNNNIDNKTDNDNDNDNAQNNNNDDEKSSRHGKLVTYKPFILESRETPRFYYPTYHINTWSWDDNTKPNTPASAHPFPTPQEFLRQLDVGDTIGVWGRVGKGETYHIIDAMRMHVFWAI